MSAALPPQTTTPIQATLRAARRRMVTQRLFDALTVCALAEGGVLIALYALQYFRAASPHQSGLLMSGTGFLALLVALGLGAVDWPSIARTATLLDRRAGTHDRFHTALKFAERPERSSLEDLTLAECARFAASFPVRRWLPLSAPRALRYLAVPLLLGGGLLAYAHFHPYQPPRPTALDGAVARQAEDLKKLAEKLRSKSPDARTPEDKLAEELKNSARRLQDTANQADPEKLKSALRELSSLEAMLRAMKDAAREGHHTPEEMAALTAALAANEQTRAAAESLQAGNAPQAGAQLEKLLSQLQKDGDPAQTLQQLAQSMQEQSAKLTEQQKSEVAQQMQQAAQAAQSGQSGLSQQSLQRLAQLLQKMGGNKGNSGKGQQGQQQQGAAGQSGQGSPMTQQQLDQLISALENMKEGLQPGNEGQQPGNGQGQQPGEGRSLALVESFGKPGGNPEPGMMPSGQPGGDMDQGHSENVLAEKAAATAPKSGIAKRLEGTPGEGESLQELVNTSGDASKAGRAYRQLYDAAVPAAQNAVEQENIPLGSRRYVRRYFENIRPQN